MELQCYNALTVVGPSQAAGMRQGFFLKGHNAVIFFFFLWLTVKVGAIVRFHLCFMLPLQNGIATTTVTFVCSDVQKLLLQ